MQDAVYIVLGITGLIWFLKAYHERVWTDGPRFMKFFVQTTVGFLVLWAMLTVLTDPKSGFTKFWGRDTLLKKEGVFE